MVPIRKILVPVNFSEPCRTAASFAVDLARPSQATVSLLHVVDPLVSTVGFEGAALSLEMLADQREQASRHLREFVESLDQTHLEQVVLEGDPARTIASFAHEQGVDLILMPTRGLGVFRRLLIGSVTAKVLHDAECPVWTGVHPEALTTDGNVSIKRVACAVDLGPQTRAVLRSASAFANSFDARLSVVHVIPVVPDPTWQERLSRMAREQVCSQLKEMEIPADIRIEFGTSPSGVTRAIEHLNADLAFVGRGHISSGGRLRSDAYAIIRDSHCPVVSV